MQHEGSAVRIGERGKRTSCAHERQREKKLLTLLLFIRVSNCSFQDIELAHALHTPA